MCKLSYLMHYQLVHWHSIINLPLLLFTPAKDCVLHYHNLHQMAKMKCKEPTVKGFNMFMMLNSRSHNIWLKLTDILYDAVIEVMLIQAVDTHWALLWVISPAGWGAEEWRHQWVKMFVVLLEGRELFGYTCVSNSLNNWWQRWKPNVHRLQLWPWLTRTSAVHEIGSFPSLWGSEQGGRKKHVDQFYTSLLHPKS